MLGREVQPYREAVGSNEVAKPAREQARPAAAIQDSVAGLNRQPAKECGKLRLCMSGKQIELASVRTHRRVTKHAGCRVRHFSEFNGV